MPTDSEAAASPPTTMPAIRRSMMPRDTNALGTIFGGVILAEIDLAAGIEALEHCNHVFVTVAIDQVDFKQPVCVGDLVSFHTETGRIGRTSIRIQVEVWALKHRGDGEQVHVTSACVTMVSVDEEFRPKPIPRPTRKERA